MYRHLYFFFVAQNLYDIDLFSALRFINEDIVKYAECDWEWDSEFGNVYICDMNPKHYHIIPNNFTESITFL